MHHLYVVQKSGVLPSAKSGSTISILDAKEMLYVFEASELFVQTNG